MRINIRFRALSTVVVGCCACLLTSARVDAATSAYWRFEDIIRRPIPPFTNVERPPALLAELFTDNPNGPSDLTSDDSIQVNDLPAGPNHLRTFNNSATGNATSPFWIDDVPSATVTQSGAANLRSTFYPEGAPFTDDIYSVAGAPINTQDFAAYTIEASFKTPRPDSYQIIMGKDGPTGRAFLDNVGQLISPQPAFSGPTTTAPLETFELGYSPFQMKMLADNFTDFLSDPGDGDIEGKLVIEMVDDSSQGNTTTTSGIHRLVSDNAILADTWYSVAVVNDGATASLYLKQGAGEYVLQDTETVSGAFGGKFNNADPGNINDEWTVGRGFLTRFQHQADGPDPDTLQDRVFQGDIRDWFQGNIDEVRISDVALNPSQFLFAEPSDVDADFDDDGDVDGNDFLIIQRGIGSTTTAADIEAFKAQFGSAVAAAGAVPEPTSVLLIAMGAAMLAAVRFKSRGKGIFSEPS